MRLLVPHTSHLTQPLDLGVFGLVKNHLRGEATYAMNLGTFDDAVAEELDPDPTTAPAPEPDHPRAERGYALAEYISDIVDAFERATTRRLVVSAFAQAGILYASPGGQSPFADERRVSYVDPTRARALVRKTGLFRDVIPSPALPGNGFTSKPCGSTKKEGQNSIWKAADGATAKTPRRRRCRRHRCLPPLRRMRRPSRRRLRRGLWSARRRRQRLLFCRRQRRRRGAKLGGGGGTGRGGTRRGRRVAKRRRRRLLFWHGAKQR